MNTASEIRIGVLVPAGNTIHERELLFLGATNVTFRFLPFSYPASGSTIFCSNLTEQLAAPIKELKAWEAQAILLGCTTASMTCADEGWLSLLERMANVPVITAAGASSQAIGALGVNSVAVATPYGVAGNLIVANFLRGQGVKVAAIEGLALDRSMEIWRQRAPYLSTQEVLDFCLSVDVDDAQAMYLPCTGIGSLEVLELFEKKTGKPAFSSVQAGYWASLRRLGIDCRAKGFGRLIEVWDF